ncbi:type II toxin-antitoxin system ParD family antitoxin [Reyranella sp.]|uniref:type II toxin-antitoxin system ParD family antitoxin n=1 Tax=Reyranella sp. TaxID=1929291 RepID=UPI003BA84C55
MTEPTDPGEGNEPKLATLRAAFDEGDESGPATPFDFEAFIAAKRRDCQPSDTGHGDGTALAGTRKR